MSAVAAPSSTVRRVRHFGDEYITTRSHRVSRTLTLEFEKAAEVTILWWDSVLKRYVRRNIYVSRGRAEQFERNGH